MTYEPYQEDKLTILSPTPLERVGDVADRIVCKDGVYGVEKNVKEYTFTGSENIVVWNGTTDRPNTNTVFCPNLLVDAYMNDHSITSISNKFKFLQIMQNKKHLKTQMLSCFIIFCYFQNHQHRAQKRYS